MVKVFLWFPYFIQLFHSEPVEKVTTLIPQEGLLDGGGLRDYATQRLHPALQGASGASPRRQIPETRIPGWTAFN